MKIYINGRFLTQQITGVQRYAHEIVRALDRIIDANTEVVLLVPRGDVMNVPQLSRIRVVHAGRYAGYAWEQIELPRMSADGLLFCPGNIAPLSSLLRGRPVVTTVHDLSYNYFPDAYSWRFKAVYKLLIPAVLRYSSRVVTVSQSEAAAISTHYPRSSERLTAIQNGGFGLDALEDVECVAPKDLGFRFGLYVGSLSKRKNFPMLLDAVVDFVRDTGCGFVFVGGVQRSLRSSSQSVPQDVANRIVFAGQVNETRELISWYKGAAFTAFPSLYEASPLPPIEAMSCGSPVIASSIPSLIERCGEAALYCDAQDRQSIARAMFEVSTKEGLRKDLIRKGLLRAKAFSWDACARQTLEVFQSSISGEVVR